MHRLLSRGRRASAALAALAPLVLGACSLEDNLLEPQQPGVVQPEDIASSGATGAIGLYTGALGVLKSFTCGGGNNNNQSICMYSDLFTDVWGVSDTFVQRIDMDRRSLQINDAEITGRYSTIAQSRGFFRDALNSLKANDPSEPERQGEMYFAMGYAEMLLAEYFCNGIPIGETINGVPKYDTDVQLTNVQVYTLALAHFDSALTLSAGTNALSVRVRNAAAVAKGRTLLDLNRPADAATAVAGVATNYYYAVTFTQTTGDNAIWTNNVSAASSARYVVGDSVQLVQGVATRIRNAIPFASLGDSRVPVSGTYANTQKGFDGTTGWVASRLYLNRSSPVFLASGVDARLIEAEARLRANDIAGMTTILNTLRASAQVLGDISSTVMPALATPPTTDAAIDLLFREKALWQFGRGTRLGDLRRLIRQYGRTEPNVFPEGGFHKSPFAFGDDVNFAVPNSEIANPNFKGCFDRNA